MIKALGISLAKSAVVVILSMIAFSIMPEIGCVVSLVGSFLLLLESYRREWKLTRFRVLMPPITATICFFVQMLAFRDTTVAWVLFLPVAVAGWFLGWLRGKAHEVYAKKGRIYAQRTVFYLSIWVACYGVSQTFGLLKAKGLVSLGLLSSAFSTAMLFAVAVVLLKKRAQAARVMATAMIMFGLPLLVIARASDPCSDTSGDECSSSPSGGYSPSGGGSSAGNESEMIAGLATAAAVLILGTGINVATAVATALATDPGDGEVEEVEDAELAPRGEVEEVSNAVLTPRGEIDEVAAPVRTPQPPEQQVAAPVRTPQPPEQQVAPAEQTSSGGTVAHPDTVLVGTPDVDNTTLGWGLNVLGDMTGGIIREIADLPRQMGQAADWVANQLTDSENWRVAGETVATSAVDVVGLAVGHKGTTDKVGANMQAGIEHMGTIAGTISAAVENDPAGAATEVVKVVIGAENWGKVIDPNVPLGERMGRAIWGAVDTTSNVAMLGSGVVSAGGKVASGVSKLDDLARGVNAIDKISDAGTAANAARAAASVGTHLDDGAAAGARIIDRVDEVGEAAGAAARIEDAGAGGRLIDQIDEVGEAAGAAARIEDAGAGGRLVDQIDEVGEAAGAAARVEDAGAGGRLIDQIDEVGEGAGVAARAEDAGGGGRLIDQIDEAGDGAGAAARAEDAGGGARVLDQADEARGSVFGSSDEAAGGARAGQHLDEGADGARVADGADEFGDAASGARRGEPGFDDLGASGSQRPLSERVRDRLRAVEREKGEHAVYDELNRLRDGRVIDANEFQRQLRGRLMDIERTQGRRAALDELQRLRSDGVLGNEDYGRLVQNRLGDIGQARGKEAAYEELQHLRREGAINDGEFDRLRQRWDADVRDATYRDGLPGRRQWQPGQEVVVPQIAANDCSVASAVQSAQSIDPGLKYEEAAAVIDKYRTTLPNGELGGIPPGRLGAAMRELGQARGWGHTPTPLSRVIGTGEYRVRNLRQFLQDTPDARIITGMKVPGGGGHAVTIVGANANGSYRVIEGTGNVRDLWPDDLLLDYAHVVTNHGQKRIGI